MKKFSDHKNKTMLGATVPTRGGFHTGFSWGDKWNCQSIQIYLTLSRRWQVPKLTQQGIAKFKTAWKNSSVKQVVAHVPYLVNLASSNQAVRQKSIQRLKIEISRAEKFGVRYLVLHPGSSGNLGKKEGIKRTAKALEIVLQNFNRLSTKILLETMAGQGSALGSRFEEIAEILRKTSRPKALGVCFDTSHVFAAGYNLKGYHGYKTVMQKFNQIIGLDKIACFHLNDSRAEFNSRRDRHASIGEGKLGLQTFHALLRDSRFLNHPKLLEIPERDQKSKNNLILLDLLSQIRQPLPEEKYTLAQLIRLKQKESD